MPPDGKLRPWREIARELAREENPMKILALSQELTDAIAEQGSGRKLSLHQISRTAKLLNACLNKQSKQSPRRSRIGNIGSVGEALPVRASSY